MPEPITVTINEAARRSGLSTRFLYERKQAGDFDVIYVGTRRYVIVWDSFVEWLNRQPREASDA